MEGLGASETAAEMERHENDMMGGVEMFPSSAVAQTHVPGSAAHIGTLQQPPLHHSLSHHHQRTPSIFQNPSFDNKHSAYRSVTDSTNVVKGPSPAQQGSNKAPQPAARPSNSQTTTSTSTATSSAMMVDADTPHPEAKTDVSTQTSNAIGSDAGANVNARPAEPNVEQADAGTNAAVRKVR